MLQELARKKDTRWGAHFLAYTYIYTRIYVRMRKEISWDRRHLHTRARIHDHTLLFASMLASSSAPEDASFGHLQDWSNCDYSTDQNAWPMIKGLVLARAPFVILSVVGGQASQARGQVQSLRWAVKPARSVHWRTLSAKDEPYGRQDQSY